MNYTKTELALIKQFIKLTIVYMLGFGNFTHCQSAVTCTS